MTAHAEKAADREHGIWVLSVGAHEEVVDLTDGFVVIVDNAAADDLRRAIAGSQLLHIDLGELHGLRRDLSCCRAEDDEHPDHCGTGENYSLAHFVFPQLLNSH